MPITRQGDQSRKLYKNFRFVLLQNFINVLSLNLLAESDIRKSQVTIENSCERYLKIFHKVYFKFKSKGT